MKVLRCHKIFLFLNKAIALLHQQYTNVGKVLIFVS